MSKKKNGKRTLTFKVDDKIYNALLTLSKMSKIPINTIANDLLAIKLVELYKETYENQPVVN